MTKRGHHDPGGANGRVASRLDGVPQRVVDEVSERIDMLSSNPLPPSEEMSQQDLSMLLATFEANLGKLNQSLTREAKNNQAKVRNFSAECERTRESVDDLNVELNLVVRREVG